MRVAVIRARIGLVAALAGMLAGTTLAAAQAQPSSPKSFASRHSVVVIGHNSPLFDSLLQKDFLGVTEVNYFQQIEPLLAIIHNNTRRVVKAYVVKWTITNTDGTTSTKYLTVIQAPLAQWTLTGQRTVLGPAGTGLGTQLTSPFFHWSRKSFPSLLKVNAVMISFQVANRKPLVSSIQGATSIQATLDGAIFGDGVFIGPDTSKLFERFQAAQKAESDEGAWMLNLLKSGPSTDEIKTQLSQQVYDGFGSAGMDPLSLYKAARGRMAQRFLRVLARGGQPRLQNLAQRLVAAKLLALRK